MLITICDDNVVITEFIKDITLKHFPKTEVVTFVSGKKMVEYIIRERIPDIIISDICIGDEDGIEELKQVRDRLQYARIIFITGFFDRCQDIFINFNPYGLLTKPIQEKNLLYYLNKIMTEEELSEDFYVYFRGNKFRISGRDVIFIESVGRKVIYHTRNNDFEEYIKLDEVMKKVKQHFLRCHKSYVVNLNYVTEHSAKYFTLKNGSVVPISRNYAKESKARYLAYMADTL